MYDFRDLFATDEIDNFLPSEAMTFNGKTIEIEIPEYRTLQVTGRELMGQELNTLVVGNQDGERIQSSRRPAREITIKYQIDADSNERFRECFNQLNMLLAGQDNMFSFRDESDKYFKGTVTEMESVDGGRNSVVSDFTILCTDPYKYALAEDEFPEPIDTNAGNLLLRSSAFEDSRIASGSCTIKVDKANTYNGNYSLEINKSISGNLSSGLIQSDYLGSHVDGDNVSLTFYAKTLSGTVNFHAECWGGVGGQNYTIDTTWKKYTATFKNKADHNQLYFWPQQIGVVLINSPMLANGSTPLPWVPATSEATIKNLTLDYSGKVAGNLNSNPNTIYGAEWHEIENRKPDSLWWEWEQVNYGQIQSHDSNIGTYTRTEPGNSTRLVMKFDLLKSINHAYPGFWQQYGIDKNDQLAWLKSNLSAFNFNVWSCGRGATGWGVKVQYWNGTEWVGTQTNTSKTPALNSYSFTATELMNYVDADGYLYFLSGTNDASESATSIMYLDYAGIDITLTLPVADSFIVKNEGPLPVPIRFEVTNHKDNGFLGITNDEQSVLIGKTDDIDGGIVEKSERLFTTKQDNSIGLSQWIVNGGVINDWNEDPRQAGQFHPPYEERWRLRNNGGYEYWGNSSSNNRGWHGPTVYTEFDEDSSGATGAYNFTARAYVNILSPNMRQGGLTEVNLSGPDKEFIVGVQIWKPNNGHGGIKVRIGSHWAYIDEYNARWDNFFGSILIRRSGNKYTIEVQDQEGGLGTKQTINFDDAESAKTPVTGFTYWKAMWGNQINNVSYQDFYDFWFQKDNVDNYVNIPNTFYDGDEIIVGGNDHKITTTVNGSLALAMQDIGSQPIMAYPGDNMISFMYSSFADQPTVKAYIRRKYL